jgi:hypothetical protein
MPSIVFNINVTQIEIKYLYEGIFGENVDCRRHLVYIRVPLVSNCRNVR